MRGVCMAGHKSHRPIPAHRKTYDSLYRLYRQLHDAFGGLNKSAGLSQVMKERLSIKSGVDSGRKAGVAGSGKFMELRRPRRASLV
ncbi:MAG: hypothetical protein ACREF9_08595, partial [Opitutaceae bacterium]